MAKLTEEYLLAYLSNLAEKGQRDIGSNLASDRTWLLANYHGANKTKTKRGADYSTYNTEEIFETVQRILAPMVKALISGRGVVSFQPLNREDVAQAAFESKVVNHLILNANDGSGYLALYSFCLEAALYPNSYIYTDVESITKIVGRRENHLTGEDLAMLMQEENTELKDTVGISQDEETGEELIDVLVEEEKDITRLVIMGIPPEDVAYRSSANSPLISDLDFIGVRFRKTYSDLIEAGYAKKKLDNITPQDDLNSEIYSERISRLFYAKQDLVDYTGEDHIEPFSKAEKEYVLWKFWLNIDYDRDGRSEYRTIHVSGNKVLLNEPTDYCPLSSMSLMINPHTHVGRSPAQAVAPLQKLRTSVMRTMLDDNVYGAKGKTFIDVRKVMPGEATTGALYSRSVPFVFVQGDPASGIHKTPQERTLGDMLALTKELKDEASLRTGAPIAQMPEANQLSNVKSGAMESAIKQTSERTELLIRTAAETGFRSLGRLVHQLCRKHPELIKQIQVEGQWQEVYAERWPERQDIAVKAGLGFTNPDKVVQNMNLLMPLMEKLMPLHMVGHEQIYNAMSHFIEALDMGSPDNYLADPIEAKQMYMQAQQNQQPGTDEILAQATMQDVQNKDAREREKIELSREEKQGKLQIELEKLRQAAEKNELSSAETAAKIAEIIDAMAVSEAAEQQPAAPKAKV